MNREENVLSRYLNDIKDYPLISPEREIELSDIIHGPFFTVGEKERAKEELVLGNLRLVVNIATKVYHRVEGYDDTNLTLMDLIQAGNIALVHAVELFRADKHNKFVTYAYVSIERRIMTAFKESKFIRIPADHFKYIHDIDEMKEKFGEMENEDIAKKMEIKEETVRRAKANKHARIQLENIDETMERIDSGSTPISEALHQQNLRGYVFDKIKELKPRHQEVLFYRFFSNQEMTLEQIGKKLGITREAIRMILAHSLCKIKHKIDSDIAFKSVINSKKEKNNEECKKHTGKKRNRRNVKNNMFKV